MNKNVLIAGVVFVSASLVAISAVAQGPGYGRHGEKMSFQDLDTDGNGEITKAEMEQRGAARFAAADTDKDGKLSQQELVAGAQKQAQDRVVRMIDRFDADGDGALSVEEMPKHKGSDRMFERVDKDNNGSISEAEFSEARSRMDRHSRKQRKSGADKN